MGSNKNDLTVSVEWAESCRSVVMLQTQRWKRIWCALGLRYSAYVYLFISVSVKEKVNFDDKYCIRKLLFHS